MPVRQFVPVLIAVLSLTSARAFADEGAHVVSLERAFGLSAWSNDEGPGAVGNSAAVTRSGILFGVGQLSTHTTPYQMARLGYDYRFGFGLTLGVAGGVSQSSYNTTEPGATIASKFTNLSVIVAPRVGYLWRLSDLLSFWPRIGVTWYTSIATSGVTQSGAPTNYETDTTSSGFGATIEPMLVLHPWDHVAFLFALNVDMAMSGTIKVVQAYSPEATASNRYANYGLTFGLTASF